MWRIKNTSAPWYKKACSRAESGHQTIEMGPQKTKGTHLSFSQRRCQQPNCHRKHEVWELPMCLTALEGSLRNSLGGSCQERVEAVLLGEAALSWTFHFAVGGLGFSHAITIEHESLHFLYVVPPYLPTPLHTHFSLPQSSQKIPIKLSSLIIWTNSWSGSSTHMGSSGHKITDSFSLLWRPLTCCPGTSIVSVIWGLMRSALLQNCGIRISTLTRSPDDSLVR